MWDVTQALTADDGGADSVPNFEIDFEVRSKLYDLARKVAPGVGTICGEVPVGCVTHIGGKSC